MMRTTLSAWSLRYPRIVIAAALLFSVAAAVFGVPAFTGLAAGGFDVPGSESDRAEKILQDKFGAGGMSVVFAVTGAEGPASPAAIARGKVITAALESSPYVHGVVSYWTVPALLRQPFESHDSRTALVFAQVAGGDRDAPRRAHDLAAPLVGTHDGVAVSVGGQAIAYYEAPQQARIDLVRMESIAVPITLLVLVWVFGSAVAALLPLAVVAVAMAGTTATLWAIFHYTDVSAFALNFASAVCLAFSVDYSLLIVSRYREELKTGTPRARAIIRTMHTAGRTVTYSALIMVAALATMLIFPQYFLRSLGYAGLAGVGFSLLGSLVVTPALLVVLGARIDAFNIRRFIRRSARRSIIDRKVDENFWYRVAVFAMRRATAVTLTLIAGFLVLLLPALEMKLAYPDDRVLPTSMSSREVGDLLRNEFSPSVVGAVQIVIPHGVQSVQEVGEYAQRLSEVDGVVAVSSPGGVFVHRALVSTSVFAAASIGDAAYLTVQTNRDPFSDEGRALLSGLRKVDAPAETLSTGLAQQNVDDIAGITDRIPLVLALIALVTLVLVFLMTGSLILPVKTLITNAISLTAAFGVMVWILQDGHLGGLGTLTTGHVIAFILPLLGCVAYALSIDYEVFVLSRMREEWLRSGRSAAGNMQAVARGLARTGPIVTAAAVIMTVVFLAITAGQVAFMRGLGLGLTVSVLVDAFIVRTLLVPAVMRFMGKWNWWAPSGLARWHTRWGLREDGVMTDEVTVLSGEEAGSETR
jgi:RND superfamily putative drug exporter